MKSLRIRALTSAHPFEYKKESCLLTPNQNNLSMNSPWLCRTMTALLGRLKPCRHTGRWHLWQIPLSAEISWWSSMAATASLSCGKFSGMTKVVNIPSLGLHFSGKGAWILWLSLPRLRAGEVRDCLASLRAPIGFLQF